MARILHADNDTLTRRDVKEILELRDHIVVPASSAGDATGVLNFDEGKFDLVIIGLGLGDATGNGGYRLLDYLPGCNFRGPVLIYSDQTLDPSRVDYSGDIETLSKPDDLRNLADVVDSLLQTGREK